MRIKDSRIQQRTRRGKSNALPLSECPEEGTRTIVENHDKQSMEMGLFSGARVQVIRNTIESPNMVIAINESRYMLNKETARKIKVI